MENNKSEKGLSQLERNRKLWNGKSDEWLFDRISNELKDKVEEIQRLLDQLKVFEAQQIEIGNIIKDYQTETIGILSAPLEMRQDLLLDWSSANSKISDLVCKLTGTVQFS